MPRLQATYVSIRQHPSAYVCIRLLVSIRQHASAYVSIRQHAYVRIREHTSELRDASPASACMSAASVSIRPAHVSMHTSAYARGDGRLACERRRRSAQRAPACKPHTSASVSIRQHTSAYVCKCPKSSSLMRSVTYGIVCTPPSGRGVRAGHSSIVTPAAHQVCQYLCSGTIVKQVN